MTLIDDMPRPVRPAADDLDRPRRILFVDHTAQMSGGEIALLNLVRHLDRTRYEPVVLLLADGPLRGELAAAGVDVHVVPLGDRAGSVRKETLGLSALLRVGSIGRLLAFAWRTADVVRRLRVDLVHTNSLKADVVGGLAGRWAGRPVLWHVRDRIADDYLPRPAVAAFRWMAGWLPTAILANSAATLATVPSKRPSRVVHDGLPDGDWDRPRPSGPRRRVGLVGRLTRWKGQHVFLAAAAEIARRFPDARFLLVGSAMFGEAAYERELREQVAALGLCDVVEFAGFRPDVAAVLADLDVLVHASVTPEPFGQVIVEGMAAGLPVVATAAGGPTEIVVDGVTGRLVPPGDAAAMAAAVCDLLADPAGAAAMGSVGRRRVADRFTMERTAAGVQAFYDDLLAKPARRTPAGERWTGRV